MPIRPRKKGYGDRQAAKKHRSVRSSPASTPRRLPLCPSVEEVVVALPLYDSVVAHTVEDRHRLQYWVVSHNEDRPASAYTPLASCRPSPAMQAV